MFRQQTQKSNRWKSIFAPCNPKHVKALRITTRGIATISNLATVNNFKASSNNHATFTRHAAPCANLGVQLHPSEFMMFLNLWRNNKQINKQMRSVSRGVDTNVTPRKLLQARAGAAFWSLYRKTCFKIEIRIISFLTSFNEPRSPQNRPSSLRLSSSK